MSAFLGIILDELPLSCSSAFWQNDCLKEVWENGVISLEKSHFSSLLKIVNAVSDDQTNWRTFYTERCNLISHDSDFEQLELTVFIGETEIVSLVTWIRFLRGSHRAGMRETAGLCIWASGRRVEAMRSPLSLSWGCWTDLIFITPSWRLCRAQGSKWVSTDFSNSINTVTEITTVEIGPTWLSSD